MPNSQQEFQKKLRIEREVLASQLQKMRSQCDNESIDIVTLHLIDKTQTKIACVDRALQRIEESTFGICRTCGKPIDNERLIALPYAEMCIDCQRRLERKIIHQYTYAYT